MEGLFGFTANVISTALVHPIDVIKTNYQLRRSTNPEPVTRVVKSIWRTHGLRGFYAGLMPNVSTYPIFWAAYFGSDQVLGNNRVLENEFGDRFIKSYGASVIGSTLTNPLFVIKTRMQNENRSKGLIETVRGVNKNGYQAYFRGMASTYVNNLKLGIQFPMYELIKKQTDSIVVASLGAKLASSSLLYPFDLIRVVQRDSDRRLTSLQAGKQIIKTGGIRGLYRGVFLYNAVSAPNFMFMMIMMEQLRILMNNV